MKLQKKYLRVCKGCHWNQPKKKQIPKHALHLMKLFRRHVGVKNMTKYTCKFHERVVQPSPTRSQYIIYIYIYWRKTSKMTVPSSDQTKFALTCRNTRQFVFRFLLWIGGFILCSNFWLVNQSSSPGLALGVGNVVWAGSKIRLAIFSRNPTSPTLEIKNDFSLKNVDQIWIKVYLICCLMFVQHTPRNQ